MRTLHLVRHARSLPDPARPPETWGLDPADFRDAVRRAFADPRAEAVPEWEPLEALHDRLVPAVRQLLAGHPEEDVVLVGHGTAWTLLAAELDGSKPDLDAWARLRMPDVWTLTLP